ncbi:unnamed protein product [Amoebophrya sp. A25]|nr:unnamed protein product [Amoebophrya sp. A25]|eukprot:GSA25T00012592001.1
MAPSTSRAEQNTATSRTMTSTSSNTSARSGKLSFRGFLEHAPELIRLALPNMSFYILLLLPETVNFLYVFLFAEADHNATAAIAALAIGNSFVNIVGCAPIIGLNLGLDAYLPTAFGAKNFRACYEFFSRAQVVVLAYCPVVWLLLLYATEPCFRWVLGGDTGSDGSSHMMTRKSRHTEKTIELGVSYAHFQGSGILGYAVADVCRKFLAGFGETRRVRTAQAVLVGLHPFWCAFFDAILRRRLGLFASITQTMGLASAVTWSSCAVVFYAIILRRCAIVRAQTILLEKQNQDQQQLQDHEMFKKSVMAEEDRLCLEDAFSTSASSGCALTSTSAGSTHEGRPPRNESAALQQTNISQEDAEDTANEVEYFFLQEQEVEERGHQNRLVEVEKQTKNKMKQELLMEKTQGILSLSSRPPSRDDLQDDGGSSCGETTSTDVSTSTRESPTQHQHDPDLSSSKVQLHMNEERGTGTRTKTKDKSTRIRTAVDLFEPPPHDTDEQLLPSTSQAQHRCASWLYFFPLLDVSSSTSSCVVYDVSKIGAYLSVAVPSLCACVSEWWVREILTLFVATLKADGPGTLAIHSTVSSIYLMLVMVIQGLVTTASFVVGRALGEGRADLAFARSVYLALLVLVMFAVMQVALYAPILGVSSKRTDGGSRNVIGYLSQLLAVKYFGDDKSETTSIYASSLDQEQQQQGGKNNGSLLSSTSSKNATVVTSSTRPSQHSHHHIHIPLADAEQLCTVLLAVVFSITFLFDALENVLAGVWRSLGKQKKTAITYAVQHYILGLPLVAIATALMGADPVYALPAVWAAFTLDLVIGCTWTLFCTYYIAMFGRASSSVKTSAEIMSSVTRMSASSCGCASTTSKNKSTTTFSSSSTSDNNMNENFYKRTTSTSARLSTSRSDSNASPTTSFFGKLEASGWLLDFSEEVDRAYQRVGMSTRQKPVEEAREAEHSPLARPLLDKSGRKHS